MALGLYDRAQQTGTANTTVSFTVTGNVTGFQSLSVIGNGNTTYYTATDVSGSWEVGIGTYSTTGPTLTRDTILSSSNSGSAVTFSGTVNIWIDYPAEKAVNLNADGVMEVGEPIGYADTGLIATFASTEAGYNQVVVQNLSNDTNASANINISNNVSTDSTGFAELGINSSTFVGTGSFSIPSAAYLASAGTDLSIGTYSAHDIHFVTNSNTVDAMTIFDNGGTSLGAYGNPGIGNLAVNKIVSGVTTITSSAGTTVLDAASTYYQVVVGTTTQTIQLPDATTLLNGTTFIIDNDSTGNVTVIDNASATLDVIPAGGISYLYLSNNSTVAGSWTAHGFLPSIYNFNNSTADFANASITNAVWNGTTIASGYGGTGLTTYGAADYALYSTSASTLTAGTLPVAAGGTGTATAFTTGSVIFAGASGTYSQDNTNFNWNDSTNVLTTYDIRTLVGAVHIGLDAGATTQGANAVAIGNGAGQTNQTAVAVAVGISAGNLNQGSAAVAVGADAGEENQGVNAVAIGVQTAQFTQGSGAVAVGVLAGQGNQGTDAIAIGSLAGASNQGINAIAIGERAGFSSQHANSTVINATGTNLDSPAASTFTVKPVAATSSTSNLAAYDSTTGEVSYSSTNYVNASGNVGIGTNSPTTPLEIFSVGAGNKLGYPTLLSIRKDNTVTADSYSIAITNDKLGANYGLGIMCNGSAVNPKNQLEAYGKLELRTYEDAVNYQSYQEIKLGYVAADPMTFRVGGSTRMSITSAGGVSFGNTGTAYGTSGQVLQSNGDAPPTWINQSSLVAGSADTASTATIANSLNAATGYQVQSFGVGTAPSGTSGEIRATNNITAFYSSDARLKENIQDVDNALDKVCAIGSKTFDWTDDYIASKGGEDGYFVQKSDFGVVAQDVQDVFPQAVRTREDGTLAVDYEKLATLAFGAIKELVKRVEALEAK